LRLKQINLAGFKSFVDPTHIPVPGNLIGVVGPNGCGKSNIIDAVRWVLGEGSAKHLRGESMADVIFNGSSGRKPLGQASIELVFDNTDGTLGGEYASYAEIGIRRTVSRDGVSNYYLNGARCRRRDITDIFLGTGLGPRSYAIIEQNMISRVIEARADEMRAFLEEAAGISRYKERRKETETRIAHTRENLARLSDLRDEVAVSGVWKNRDALTIRNEVGREYACVENIDIQIGRVLARLEAMGEVENTYIFYTSDHGIAIGRHGLVGKQNLYEHTWRVPMIVKGPGIAAGSRVEGNIYLLDVLATLCDLAGVQPPESNEGSSFKPVLEGKTKTIRANNHA
jgi:energy-coupling factor transporter ATP-binding protein EcfA2